MLTCNEMSPVLIPSSVEIPAPRSADQLMESFMVFPKNAKDLNKIDFIAKFISTHIISYGELKILTRVGMNFERLPRIRRLPLHEESSRIASMCGLEPISNHF